MRRGVMLISMVAMDVVFIAGVTSVGVFVAMTTMAVAVMLCVVD